MSLCLVTRMDFFIQLLMFPKFPEKVTYFACPEGLLWPPCLPGCTARCAVAAGAGSEDGSRHHAAPRTRACSGSDAQNVSIRHAAFLLLRCLPCDFLPQRSFFLATWSSPEASLSTLSCRCPSA